MATTLTPNLKLRIDSNLTANAKYNLSRIDLLGATFLVDSTNTATLRSQTGIIIEPNSADIGGAGSGGTVSIGTLSHKIAALNIYSTSLKLTGTLGLDNGTHTTTLAPADSGQTQNLTFKLPSNYGTAGQVLGTDGSGNTSWTIPASGTVTSVGIAAPAEFVVSSSPVTGAGTLTLTKANQTANKVFAGPETGTAAQPTFRSLVSDDIPSLPSSKVGLGNVPNVDPTDPTTLNTIQATRLGLYRYISDVTYNNDVHLTVTSSVVEENPIQAAILIPYQTHDGNWRLKGSIPRFLISESLVGQVTYTIAGVSFSPDFAQIVTGYNSAGIASALGGTSEINLSPLSGQTELTYSGCSFDVDLMGPPTWAYGAPAPGGLPDIWNVDVINELPPHENEAATVVYYTSPTPLTKLSVYVDVEGSWVLSYEIGAPQLGLNPIPLVALRPAVGQPDRMEKVEIENAAGIAGYIYFIQAQE